MKQMKKSKISIEGLLELCNGKVKSLSINETVDISITEAMFGLGIMTADFRILFRNKNGIEINKKDIKEALNEINDFFWESKQVEAYNQTISKRSMSLGFKAEINVK